MEDLYALSVSDLNCYIRELMDTDEVLCDVWVRGEISSCKVHTSGHLYFTLKDESSQINCVMWRSSVPQIRFPLEQGVRVLAHGRVSVYERQGTYQLYADRLEPEGRGALFEAFEKLKQRLAAEGLFDEERKRPLPKVPRRVALVTSPTGAAVHDMVRILRQRHPGLDIVVVPTLVQGDEAAPSICASLAAAVQVPNVDVIILGRGGGAVEDLWAFNDERVARAIYISPVPIVSAVGHETDYTIADFVADVRAPTPTAAAAMVAPDAVQLRLRVMELQDSLQRVVTGVVDRYRRELALLTQRPILQRPAALVDARRMALQALRERLVRAVGEPLRAKKEKLGALAARLDVLSPLAVLSRGYGVFRRADNGATISSVDAVKVGESGNLMLKDGLLLCRVDAKEEKDWSVHLRS
ncbi:MAG: exodeoxyribonuclease VII large subunit [Armatimonadota bacterium]